MTNQSTFNVIRIKPSDLERFLSLRAEGLRSDPDSFRVTPEDDEVLGTDYWRERLGRDYVIAAASDAAWLGIGGLTRLSGKKLQHKGLLWGMYVQRSARGSGVADAIMNALIAHARPSIRQLQLTVIADNIRAISFYERYGFKRYGVEPHAVKLDNSFADEAMMWRTV